MKEYTIVYDEKNHERKYIRYEVGIPIILSKDIVIDECNKEIERLNKELQDTKEHLGEYLYEQEEENKRLNNIINELEKNIEEELDRLARETSHIYEDSLGKTKLVNEDIFEELSKIKNKLQELKGDGSNEKDTNE